MMYISFQSIISTGVAFILSPIIEIPSTRFLGWIWGIGLGFFVNLRFSMKTLRENCVKGKTLGENEPNQLILVFIPGTVWTG